MENITLSISMDIAVELSKLFFGTDKDFNEDIEFSTLVVTGNNRKYGIDLRYNKENIINDYKPIIDCLNKFLTGIEARAYMDTEKLVVQFIADNTFKPEEDQYIDIVSSVDDAIKNIKFILRKGKYGSVQGSTKASRRKRKWN